MTCKRILTIQDISCVGQCSMTVAMPVLSACGHEISILPTAMLSTHTGGFGKPAVLHLSHAIQEIREHWLRENIRFDAIYTGYLGDISAIHEAETIADSLLIPGGKLIVDPALADHGKLYSGFDDAYVEAMGDLLRRADLILPNITEAAIFSGLTFEETLTEDYVDRLLTGLSHPCVVLTGAGYGQEETGVAIWDHGKRLDYRHRKLPKNSHGTGDLFAACFTGAYLRGKDILKASKIAADTVLLAMERTEDAHWYGTRFETALPDLMRMLTL